MGPLGERLAARGYHVVAPWLRGYWPSPIDGAFDVESLVADVIAMDDALDREASSPQAKYLVGHDWGAVIGWALLLEETRFRRAALLAVPHPLAFLRGLARHPKQTVRSRYMAFFQLGRIADLRVARDGFAYVESLWRRWSPGFDPGPAYFAHLRETFARSHPSPLAYYRALAWPPRAAIDRVRRAKAHRIETPVLQLMGSTDGCIAPGIARGQDAFVRDLEADVLDGVGHFLHFEAPERVADRIAACFSAR